MNDRNKNLALRAASAVVLLPLAIWVTVLGGIPFAILCAAAAAVAAGELIWMFERRFGATEIYGIAGAALFPLAAWRDWHFLAPGLAFATVGLLAIILFQSRPIEARARSAAITALAWLYCGLLIGMVVGLSRLGFGHVVLAFFVTWGNDTVAYFAGRAFGRRKLSEQISPKKTWEGFAGGVLGSMLGAFLARAFVLPDLTPAGCLIIAAGGAVLGPLGDLCESMMKRAAGVKDSGRLIPGHGGLLDRIDALLFVVPWIYAYFSMTAGGR